MANDLSAIVPKIIARAALVLRNAITLPRLINSDFGREAAEKGDTIDVPIPVAVGTADVTPSHLEDAPASLTPKKVAVSLQYWRKTNGIALTDKEMHEVNSREHYLPQQVGQAMVDLAEYVNSICMSKYTAIYGHYGDPTTDPFNSTDGVKHATLARKVLAEQKSPMRDLVGVIDPLAEANALTLDAFQRVNEAGDRGPKIEGELGRKFGIDWFMDQQVPSHTTGAAGTILVNDPGAAIVVGQETLPIDGVTTDPIVGDIFTLAGDTTQYVVKTAATGAAQTIGIAPPLAAAPADNAAVSFVAAHKVNMLFHPSAWAFAMRPLGEGMETLGGNILASVFDDQTGISMRLEIKRQNKQTVWEFDVLFGVEIVRPELITRIIGNP